MNDTFVAYETGLQLLLEHIDKTHPECPRIISLQNDLEENIAQARLSNDTPELCEARKRIVGGLNTVVIPVMSISFIDICILTYIITAQKTVEYAYEVFHAKERIWLDQCDYIIDSFRSVRYVLDTLTADMMDDVSVDLDHIDDCMVKITGLLEDFKEVCQKPTRYSQTQRQQILLKLHLLIDGLKDVEISFREFIRLEENEASRTDNSMDQEQPQEDNHQNTVTMADTHSSGSERGAQTRDQREDQAMPAKSGERVSSGGIHQTKLRKAMVRAFTLEELESLCADIEQDLRNDGRDLEVNLEVIEAGKSKDNKVLKLIQYLYRNGCLPYLATAVRRARWDITF